MKVNDRRYKKATKRLAKFIKRRLPKSVLEEFKKNTPRDKGNARRKTTKKRISGGFIIEGNYEYSGVLDRGMFPNPPKEGTGKTRNGFSTQAPKGMIEPTVKTMEKEIKDFIKRNT